MKLQCTPCLIYPFIRQEMTFTLTWSNRTRCRFLPWHTIARIKDTIIPLNCGRITGKFSLLPLQKVTKNKMK